MAKGKGQIQGWITKNGVHIPIYGQYTVRGGVEPKAKGSKFKRKKRPEEFDKDIRETEGGKFMAQYSSDQGKKKGVKDIEKPFDTKEEARAFLAKENGEYEDVKGKKERNVLGQEVDFAEVDRTAKEREKDFIVNTPIPEGKAWERAESKRKAMEAADEADAYDRQHKEGKYANRDFSSDLAGAHKAGYSAQSEEGKPSVDFSKMSYSEAGKYVSEHRKDFGLKAGDDAYQAAYEMKQGTWKQSKQENKTVSITESYPWTKSFGSNEPSASEYGKAMDSINERYDRETKTVPGKEMGKVFEGLKPGDQIKVHNRWSTSPDTYTVNEDGTIDYSTPSSAFLGKEGMSLAEAQKHATNSVDNRITVMRRKTEEGNSTPTIHETRLQRQAVNEKAGLKSDRNQNFKTAYQNEGSSTPTSDRKSYESLGRYAERKVDEAKTRNEMAQDRASAANFKQSYSVGDRHSNVGYETAQKMFDAPVGTKITMSNHNLGDYVGEYTKTERGWVGSQDYKSSRKNLPTVNSADAFATYVQGNDVRVVSTDASAPKAKPIGGGRVPTSTHTEKQDSLSEGMAKRREIRAQISDTNKAKSGNFGDMTVSGLKQALAGARPGDKTKIRAELRKRGYTYVGGKWIKA